jgi:hypothetical protein
MTLKQKTRINKGKRKGGTGRQEDGGGGTGGGGRGVDYY